MFINNLSIRYKIALGTGIPLVLLVFLSFIAITSSNSQSSSNAMVDHTHKVIQQAMKIEAAAVDMETGMRGYLLAGKEEFLAPYTNGQESFSSHINKLKQTVSDNPPQVQRLNEIEANINEWLSNVTEPAIQLRREIGNAKTMDDIADLIAEARGKVYFDKFRDQISLFIEREQLLLNQRQTENGVNFSNSVILLEKIRAKGNINQRELIRMSGFMDELETASDWVNHTYQVIGTAQNILASAVDMETGMRGYLLAGRSEFLEPYEQGKQRFNDLIADQTRTVSDNPAQVDLLGEMQATIDEWQTNVVQPNIALRTDIGDAKTMNDMAALIGEAKGKVYFDKFRGQIKTFIDIESDLMEDRQAAAKNAARNTNTTIMVGLAIAILLGVAVSWVVLNSIVKPVSQVAQGLSTLADGNLTHTIEVETSDELGKMASSYNRAVLKTQTALKEVLNTTDEVASGAKSITQANELMAQDLSQQAAQVAQISESIEQIAVSIQEVAQKSSDATSSAQSAGESANAGGSVVKNTIEGMTSINEAVSASSTSVAELGKRGAKIGEIIGVINDIAEQTNLLALNAAIEAARAGEAGRGFAVVADEVRALADRTTSATQEITVSIEAIQHDTKTAVDKMDAGMTHVQEGLGLAQQAGTSLDDIVQSAHDVAVMIDSIAAASEEQSLASSEVSQHVESVSSVSRKANEQASLAAASAKELDEKAAGLKVLVDQFTV
ncbi:HAMP domain-containing protein [Vibrio sp. T187]|uniref:CHASE3 domain-containing protein n=1 Tax=Vibrio TaxID=662 RepID=UPI0010C9817F|nr:MULTISPECIES: CHASE3 domain-containing protein [Vibrio]MBW3695763.1 HAMP domain-containing protein [Vibrio sp. T187]